MLRYRTALAEGAVHLAVWRWNRGAWAPRAHRFPDAEGTELDGGTTARGGFVFLLHVEDTWAARTHTGRTGRARAWWLWAVARRGGDCRCNAAWTGVEDLSGEWTELPDLTKEHEVFSGEIA